MRVWVEVKIWTWMIIFLLDSLIHVLHYILIEIIKSNNTIIRHFL